MSKHFGPGERLARIARESGWIVAGQVGGVLGTLVLVRIVTEHLTPAEYGELSLTLTIAGFVNQIVIGGLSAGIGRVFVMAAEAQDVGRYFRVVRNLLAHAMSAIGLLAVVLISILASAGERRWIVFSAIALVFAAFSGGSSVLNNIQTVARQRHIVALHSTVEPWLRLGLVFVTFWFLGGGPVAVIGSFTVASGLVLASQMYFARSIGRDGGSGVPPDWARLIWSNSWPITMWGVFSWAQSASDRWALEVFSTTSAVGQYAVLFQLGYTPVTLASGLLITLIGPILFQQAGTASDPARIDRVQTLTWRFAGAAVAFTVLAACAAGVLHTPLFALTTSEAYRGISHLLPWMVLAGGLFGAGQILALKPTADLRPHRLIAPKIVTASLGVLANIACARWFGMPGVVAAVTLCSTVYVVWMAALVGLPRTVTAVMFFQYLTKNVRRAPDVVPRCE